MSQQVQQNASIGAKEFIALLTMYVVTNAFLNYPEYVSSSGLEASWMEPLISGAMTLVLFLLVNYLLARLYHGMDIVEVAKTAFGRFIAVLVSLVFACYFLATTAAVMRQFSENVITTVLPTTPILVVGLFFILSIWYVASCGLEGIARTAYIMLPLLIGGTVILCLLTMNWWRPELLLPIWGSGPIPVVSGGIRYSSIFANVLLLCVLYPHAHDPKSFRKVGVVSILLSTITLAGFVAVYHMVFTATEAGKTAFPLYQLARMIYLGRFVQRLESVFVFLWVISAVIKMAFTLWGAAYLLGTAFRWPTYRPALPALALICFAASMLPENVVSVIQFDRLYLETWGWWVVFGLPVFVVLIASFRRSWSRGGVRRA